MSRRATLFVICSLFTILSFSPFSSQAWGQGLLEFLDERGAATTTYVEGSRVFVRLTAAWANTSPGVDDAPVLLTTSRAGDMEYVTVTETGPSTGVFRGSIPLAPGSTTQPGVLETAADPNPPHDRDTIEARFDGNAVTATASMAGSRTWFLDGNGQVRQSFAVGERVHVRVADSLRNDPNDPSVPDAFQITVAVPAVGDQEVVELLETGIDTGIFEGSVATTNGGSSPGDGVIGTPPGQAIEAVHLDADLPTSSRADATMAASHAELVDAQGRPAEYYLESARVYVRVVDHVSDSPGVFDTVQVSLQADISGDQELLTLQETAPSSGVYQGSMELRRGPGLLGNGTLETHIDGPPYHFDTVRATSGTSTDAVEMIGSLTSFVDAYGNEVAAYPVGVAVRVRVEDHNFNNPSAFDTVGVTVSSPATGDAEGLSLLEVAKDSGIFEGALPTQGSTPANSSDGFLQVQVGEDVEAMHVDVDGVLASGDRARIEFASISFVDEAGRPTAELLENGTARVRVISLGGNGNPGQVDGLLVLLRSLRTGDEEEVPLAETGPDTSIFEGTIQLSYSVSASQGNGLLETGNPPPYLGDEVTASYGPYSATARTVGARVVFIDGFGRETTAFPIGSRVRVRVTDPSRNSPTNRDQSFVTLYACQSDQESFQLTETGFNTAVFEGEIPSAAQSPSNNDGTLQGLESCPIEALYSNPNSPTVTEALATFTGGEVLFVNAQGQPASVFLEGTRAYLRVVDHGRSGTVTVTVTAGLSGDLELVTLLETTSGVFTGSIELRSTEPSVPQNGILETSQESGPPHEFETLRAVYEDPSGDSTATASTLNFRVWFIDAYGAVTTTYAQGSRVYVRLEDHNFSDPGQFDRQFLRVLTSGGDEELLELLETGKTTGIYEGSIDLDSANSGGSGDGRLQAGPGDELITRRDPHFNASPARARVESVAIMFVDETGRPTVELLENGTARVRVISPYNNFNPGEVDGLLVLLRALYTGDEEELPLAETGANTGVFEGSLPLSFSSAGGIPGNGLLQTTNPYPEYPGDEVTATYGPLSATARTIGARVVFIDGFGRETTTFPLGSRVRVRVTDPSHNSPTNRDEVYLSLMACHNDQESIQLSETGFNTAVFEGEILSGSQGGGFNDGTLQGLESCPIQALYSNPNSPTVTEALATFTGGEVLFVDAQGQPASVFLEGTRAYLRVVDHGRSGNSGGVSVTVTTELSGDLEQMVLSETTPGVFTGLIELRSGPSGFVQNGILETSQAPGPPYELETLRAVYEDPSGSSTATASTLGFRLWFIDAYGFVTSSYAQGSRVYVRLEDHNANDPAQFDQRGVTVRTSRGDVELMEVLETGKTTGIYEGSFDLDGANSASYGDGRLQAGPGDELEAQYVPEVPAVKARVENAAISFIDEAGRPTVELLENGMARVRVISPYNNFNPGEIDGQLVLLRALYTGDQEELPLAETGPDTGVFEGSIQLSFSGSGSQGNNVLETANQGPEYPGEQVTATYGPFSATARTIGARVVFIDGFGRETTAFPIGSRVRVRVTDPSHNSPTSRDEIYLSLRACQTDQESIQLFETGFNTAVFEGEILSAAQNPSNNDGILEGLESCLIQALYSNPNSPTVTESLATFTGGEVLFVDAQGQPASVFLEGTRAYLRVVDHGRNGTVPVTVTTELSGDLEPMVLSETTPGVFTGSIELRSFPSGVVQNGILETSQESGPPHEFETLRAVYEDPSGSSTATASTLNFRVWFIDAYGAVTTTYPQSSRVYVRLEDHNFNDPAHFDRLGVTVRSSQGDEEPLELLETGKTTGIYEGSIDLDSVNSPNFGDGRLQASPGNDLEARVDPLFNASPAQARVENATISFIDEAGRPTVELLENGMARVRVISPYNNFNPGEIDGQLVLLRALYTGDQEELPLAETGPDTGVFEGSIQLSFSGSGSQGNNVLETANQGPEYPGELVTASYGPFSATARTIGARVVFIDGFGRETSMFPIGSRVRVRVTDPSHNSPANRDEIYLSLRACQTDQESIQLSETGFNTAVFEGEILSAAQNPSNNDGILEGLESCLIEAVYFNPNSPTETEALATFTGGEVLFVDAQGQPASVFLEGTRAYLRVVDHGRTGTVQVTVTTELSGDLEPMVLSETTPGVFTGSIELRSFPSGVVQNGILETSQESGPPHEFETLRAVYEDRSGNSTATASTLNFRVWFIDAYGAVTSTYAQGSRVYVRLEDHNFNDPAHFDRLGVTVRSSQSDEEPLQLLETGKATGIYEGSILLDGAGSPNAGDGRLQAGPGNDLDARVDPLFNASPAQARVENATISFIDEAGRPTVELLENGMARVRVISPDNNGTRQARRSADAVASPLHGRQEELLLDGDGSRHGRLRRLDPSVLQPFGPQGNNVLETGNQGPEYPGEQVTASYGPFSATARTVGARMVFIDGFGRETTTFPLGSPVRVRVTDPSRLGGESYVAVSDCQNDQESISIFATSPGVFEGEIPSSSQAVTFNDSVLQGTESCLIEAFYNNSNAPTQTQAQARFTGGEMLFVDAQGQPASVFLEGTRAYLRVVDHRVSGTVLVAVRTELSGDYSR